MAKGVTVSTKDLGIELVDKLMKNLRDSLGRAAENAVKAARAKGKEDDWTDRTGNLRSSIGVLFLDNGKPMYVSEPEAFSGENGDGSEGVAQGMAMLNRLRGEGKPNTLSVTLVAGMEYASYVEANHKNVLRSGRQILESEVHDIIEDFSR